MKSRFVRIIALVVVLCFLFESSGFAQVAGVIDLSDYANSIKYSFSLDKFRPLHLRYLSYEPENNNFKLLLDKGDNKNLNPVFVKDESKTLLNYFFLGLALPNSSFWVNLRPDAPKDIIDPDLENTDIGRIFLAADVQLKKDTASWTSPKTKEGREYWDRLYKKVDELFGSNPPSIPTLTRPWIVPDEIIIRETPSSAYVYKATLKVMLEQDYLKNSSDYKFNNPKLKELNDYSSQLIRELVIPKLNREINSSKKYAELRQVCYSLVLAQWFKARFRGRDNFYSFLIDKKNLSSLISKEPWSKDSYFKSYQKSFKDGEYNVKEQVNTALGQTIRSYVSGGMNLEGFIPPGIEVSTVNAALAGGGTFSNVITSTDEVFDSKPGNIVVRTENGDFKVGKLQVEPVVSSPPEQPEVKPPEVTVSNQKGPGIFARFLGVFSERKRNLNDLFDPNIERQPVKVLYTDLDGTIAISGEQVTPVIVEAINKLMLDGIKVVIMTEKPDVEVLDRISGIKRCPNLVIYFDAATQGFSFTEDGEIDYRGFEEYNKKSIISRQNYDAIVDIIKSNFGADIYKSINEYSENSRILNVTITEHRRPDSFLNSEYFIDKLNYLLTTKGIGAKAYQYELDAGATTIRVVFQHKEDIPGIEASGSLSMLDQIKRRGIDRGAAKKAKMVINFGSFSGSISGKNEKVFQFPNGGYWDALRVLEAIAKFGSLPAKWFAQDAKDKPEKEKQRISKSPFVLFFAALLGLQGFGNPKMDIKSGLSKDKELAPTEQTGPAIPGAWVIVKNADGSLSRVWDSDAKSYGASSVPSAPGSTNLGQNDAGQLTEEDLILPEIYTDTTKQATAIDSMPFYPGVEFYKKILNDYGFQMEIVEPENWESVLAKDGRNSNPSYLKIGAFWDAEFTKFYILNNENTHPFSYYQKIAHETIHGLQRKFIASKYPQTEKEEISSWFWGPEYSNRGMSDLFSEFKDFYYNKSKDPELARKLMADAEAALRGLYTKASPGPNLMASEFYAYLYGFYVVGYLDKTADYANGDPKMLIFRKALSDFYQSMEPETIGFLNKQYAQFDKRVAVFGSEINSSKPTGEVLPQDKFKIFNDGSALVLPGEGNTAYLLGSTAYIMNMVFSRLFAGFEPLTKKGAIKIEGDEISQEGISEKLIFKADAKPKEIIALLNLYNIQNISGHTVSLLQNYFRRILKDNEKFGRYTIEFRRDLLHYAAYDKENNKILLDVDLLKVAPDDLLILLAFIIGHEGSHALGEEGKTEADAQEMDLTRFEKFSLKRQKVIINILENLGANPGYLAKLELVLLQKKTTLELEALNNGKKFPQEVQDKINNLCANIVERKYIHIFYVTETMDAFVKGDFGHLYNILSDSEKKRTSREKYVSLLDEIYLKIYAPLSDEEKLILKIAMTLHDTGAIKGEGVRDWAHHERSAAIVKEFLESLLKDGLLNNSYIVDGQGFIDRVERLTFYHSDYSDLGLDILPKDLSDLSEKEQNLIFLTGLFDGTRSDGGNAWDFSKLQTMFNILTQGQLINYQRNNNFYEYRFASLLTPLMFIKSSENEAAKNLGEINKALGERLTDDFKNNWNNLIRIYAFAFFNNMSYQDFADVAVILSDMVTTNKTVDTKKVIVDTNIDIETKKGFMEMSEAERKPILDRFLTILHSGGKLPIEISIENETLKLIIDIGASEQNSSQRRGLSAKTYQNFSTDAPVLNPEDLSLQEPFKGPGAGSALQTTNDQFKEGWKHLLKGETEQGLPLLQEAAESYKSFIDDPKGSPDIKYAAEENLISLQKIIIGEYIRIRGNPVLELGAEDLENMDFSMFSRAKGNVKFQEFVSSLPFESNFLPSISYGHNKDIEDVLWNILHNARDAVVNLDNPTVLQRMPQGIQDQIASKSDRRVKVSLKIENNDVIFEIWDNGAGFYALSTEEKKTDQSSLGGHNQGETDVYYSLKNMQGEYKLLRAGEEGGREFKEGTLSLVRIPLKNLKLNELLKRKSSGAPIIENPITQENAGKILPVSLKDFIATIFKDKSKVSFADLGSGPEGRFAKNFLDLLSSLGIEVFDGVSADQVGMTLAHGLNYLESKQEGRLRLINLDVTVAADRAQAQVKDGSFDFVFINNILNEGLVEAAARMVKPGGYIIITFAQTDREDSPGLVGRCRDALDRLSDKKTDYDYKLLGDNGEVLVPSDYPESNSMYQYQEKMLVATKIENSISAENSLGTPQGDRQAGGGSTPLTTSSQSLPDNNKGGIDFRSLPLNIQVSLKNLITAEDIKAAVSIDNLDSEWSNIKEMLDSEVSPSGDRIKQFLIACCQRGELDKRCNDALICISDILRMDEDRALPTEAALKEFLFLLECNNSSKELGSALTGIAN